MSTPMASGDTHLASGDVDSACGLVSRGDSLETPARMSPDGIPAGGLAGGSGGSAGMPVALALLRCINDTIMRNVNGLNPKISFLVWWAGI